MQGSLSLYNTYILYYIILNMCGAQSGEEKEEEEEES